MSEFLDKKKTLFERDETGDLVPVETILELIKDKPKIKCTPIPKGEFQRIRSETTGNETNKDQDAEIIIKHLVYPKYTEKEVEFMKYKFSNAIVVAIIAVSTGIEQTKIQEVGKKKAMEDAQKALLKKKDNLATTNQ